jgi:hypothetical protein
MTCGFVIIFPARNCPGKTVFQNVLSDPVPDMRVQSSISFFSSSQQILSVKISKFHTSTYPLSCLDENHFPKFHGEHIVWQVEKNVLDYLCARSGSEFETPVPILKILLGSHGISDFQSALWKKGKKDP